VKAVHFGAGNIGRGFVGLLLHQAGYELVFADVAEELISQLAAADSYDVHEVGDNPTVRTVDNFRALNSATQEADVVAEIATADVVTTAVGPHILKFVAPVIAKGIAARAAGLAPLQVMACENAINATDILRDEVAAQWDPATGPLEATAVFANTAVDRIVPNQEPGNGLDVTVVTF
jgi:mannitol-1-phosphate 5-dehydrogenase